MFHKTHQDSLSRLDRAGKASPILAAVILLVVAVVIIVVVTFVGNPMGSRLEPLPTMAYRENPQNFLGNQYRLTGQIHSLLLWEEGTGRLVAVQPEDLTGRVAVFVPDNLGVSLHTGQRYHLDLAVREGGLLYVEDLAKY